MGGGSVKAPNGYNAGSGVTHPPTTSGPRAKYENPTQFSVYGNAPPLSTQKMAAHSNTTGITGSTGASNEHPPDSPTSSSLDSATEVRLSLPVYKHDESLRAVWRAGHAVAHSAGPAYESPTKGPEYAYAAQASGTHPLAYAGCAFGPSSEAMSEPGIERTAVRTLPEGFLNIL